MTYTDALPLEQRVPALGVINGSGSWGDQSTIKAFSQIREKWHFNMIRTVQLVQLDESE